MLLSELTNLVCIATAFGTSHSYQVLIDLILCEQWGVTLSLF